MYDCHLFILIREQGNTHANCYDGYGDIKRYSFVSSAVSVLSFYFFIYILQLIQSLPLTFSLSTRPYLSDFVDDYAVHCCAVQPLPQPQLLRQVHSHYVSLVYTVPRCWIENWKISYSWHIWNWNGTIKAVMCFFVSVCMWLAEWGYRNIWFALIWKQKGIGWHPINCACACVCVILHLYWKWALIPYIFDGSMTIMMTHI